MNRQILIVGPSWVGDMIMAQALFKVLKANDHTVEIDVLAPDWSRPILTRMPEVRATLVMPLTHGEFGLKKRYRLGCDLIPREYDQAIVLTNSWKSALIPFWAKIPVRTGWLGECRWGLLNDIRYLDEKKIPKMVDRYIALGYPKDATLPPSLPAPQLAVDNEKRQQVVTRFALKHLEQPIIALCPGAAYGPAKRWPVAHFIELARQKLQAGWQVWLFGSKQDKPVIEALQVGINHQGISFAAQIDLFETVDLMSLVQAVVSNDSGLMHMAASLGKPLVAIYGSTSSTFTPPLGQGSKILQKQMDCRPCFKRECPLKHHKCMEDIQPNDVLNALDSVMP